MFANFHGWMSERVLRAAKREIEQSMVLFYFHFGYSMEYTKSRYTLLQNNHCNLKSIFMSVKFSVRQRQFSNIHISKGHDFLLVVYLNFITSYA